VQIASSSAGPWTTMKTITNNTSLENDHASIAGTGRYVRIYGTARGTVYGYSIYELEVYGSSSARLDLTEAPEESQIENIAGLYPNPTDNILHITGMKDGTVLTIRSTTGSAVTTFTLVDGEIDVSQLSQGIYIVDLYDEGKVIRKKLIKK
jgi:hypothetical protein